MIITIDKALSETHTKGDGALLQPRYDVSHIWTLTVLWAWLGEKKILDVVFLSPRDITIFYLLKHLIDLGCVFASSNTA